MITYMKVFAAMFAMFIVLDLLWLGVIAKSFYREQLAMFITDKFNWYAAIAFYIIFIGGMIYFVLLSAPTDSGYLIIMIRAAIFGLVTYGTYDLTNLATLKSWPVYLSFVDIMWGAFLSCAVSCAGFFVLKSV